MTISAIVATFGADSWRTLAIERAVPSADAQTCVTETIHAHDPDGTIASVRNAAAAAATGEWLLFLDGDDELEPDFSCAMQTAIDEAEATDPTRLLFTPRVEYLSGSRRRPSRRKPRFWPEADIRGSNWIVIGTIIHRDLFAEIGGFRDYGWSEDWDLWGRAFNAGASVVKVPSAIYVAYVLPDSRNRSAPVAERLYWHQRIGHDNWPELYEAPTDAEDAATRLDSRTTRMLAAL